jgi:DNA polymerase III sliding clamp (beta) subunit (PCNA family)
MTLTTEDTMTTTVTVDTQDLYRVLHNAQLAVSTNVTAPLALQAVRIEVEGSTLTAVATDRYRLHMDTATVTRDDAAEAPMVHALIPRQDVAELVKMLKPLREAMSLELHTEHMTLRAPNVERRFATLLTVEYPRYRSLFPDRDAEVKLDGPFGVTPALLAGFAKVVEPDDSGKLRKAATMRVKITTATRPLLVEIGSTFRALLMPVRLPES